MRGGKPQRLDVMSPLDPCCYQQAQHGGSHAAGAGWSIASRRLVVACQSTQRRLASRAWQPAEGDEP